MTNIKITPARHPIDFIVIVLQKGASEGKCPEKNRYHFDNEDVSIVTLSVIMKNNSLATFPIGDCFGLIKTHQHSKTSHSCHPHQSNKMVLTQFVQYTWRYHFQIFYSHHTNFIEQHFYLSICNINSPSYCTTSPCPPSLKPREYQRNIQ